MRLQLGHHRRPPPCRPAATAGSGHIRARFQRARAFTPSAGEPGQRLGAQVVRQHGTAGAAGEVAAHRLAHHAEADEAERGDRPQDRRFIRPCTASSGCIGQSRLPPGQPGEGHVRCRAGHADLLRRGGNGPGAGRPDDARAAGGDGDPWRPGRRPQRVQAWLHAARRADAAGLFRPSRPGAVGRRRSRDLYARRECRGHGGAAPPPGPGPDRLDRHDRMAGWWRWRMPRATRTRCRTWC